MTRTRAHWAALIASAALIAGCSSTPAPTDSGGLTHVAVGVGPTTASIAVYLAQADKTFAANGLEVEVVTIQSGAEAVPRLLNGSLNVAFGDAVGTVQAAANGVPLRAVGVATVAPSDPAQDYAAIVAKKSSNITDVAGLSGKTVAVNQLNGGAQLTVMAAVDARGGDSSKLKFVELPFPQMTAAVKAGRVDAAMNVEPFLTQAQGSDLATVLQPQAYAVPGLPTTLIVTSSSYAGQNPTVVEKFLKAISAAGKKANEDPAAGRAVAGFTNLPAATLKVIKLPIYAENAADNSGMNQMVVLMNKYKLLQKQPDMSALLGGAPKPTASGS
jgi:NitT/TauT family transport system substrate-binding protein